MDLDIRSNFYGFFVHLLLANDRASDGNILGAYSKRCKEDFKT